MSEYSPLEYLQLTLFRRALLAVSLELALPLLELGLGYSIQCWRSERGECRTERRNACANLTQQQQHSIPIL